MTGNLVLTRRELISKLTKLPLNHFLAAELLYTLESYEDFKSEIAEDPDEYLFKLEKFFRITRV